VVTRTSGTEDAWGRADSTPGTAATASALHLKRSFDLLDKSGPLLEIGRQQALKRRRDPCRVAASRHGALWAPLAHARQDGAEALAPPLCERQRMAQQTMRVAPQLSPPRPGGFTVCS